MIEKSESQRKREAGRTRKKVKRGSAPIIVTRPGGKVETVAAGRFRRKPVRAFRLTQRQRSALFAGEVPRIMVPAGECPFVPGDVYDVPGTKNLSLGIIGLKEGRGEDALVYRVFDQRARLLRANVHSVDFASIRRSYDNRGVPKPMEDVAAVAQAAEESAYTTSPGAALKRAAEEISKAQQGEQIKVRRQKRERQIRSPISAINEQFAGLEGSSVFSGHSSTIRFLRNRLAKLEQECLEEGGRG